MGKGRSRPCREAEGDRGRGAAVETRMRLASGSCAGQVPFETAMVLPPDGAEAGNRAGMNSHFTENLRQKRPRRDSTFSESWNARKVFPCPPDRSPSSSPSPCRPRWRPGGTAAHPSQAGQYRRGGEGARVSVKKIGENLYRLGEIEFDAKSREIRFPVTVNQREGGPIEYLLVRETARCTSPS